MDSTAIGDFARRSRTVTERDIALYTEITGDRNPIHFDPALASASRFGGLVVQGGVTSGLLNALVAEQLPGPGSVFLEVAWRFLAPVRPGDVITAQATVTAVRADKPVTTLATRVTNQSGITVLDGTAVVWRDPVVVAAHCVPHHQQDGAGRSGATNREGRRMTITTENPRTNGVDTATLFATLDAVKAQPEIAKFQFRATNTWLGGTHSRSRFSGFHGAMQEMEHKHRHRGRRRPSDRPGRSGRGADPGGARAARHRGLPDRGHRQHRVGPGGRAHPRSARPSRATSTSSASSGCPTGASATATSRSR